MRLTRRIEKLEGRASVTNKFHAILVPAGEDPDSCLDAYGRDRIEPGDRVTFVHFIKTVPGEEMA